MKNIKPYVAELLGTFTLTLVVLLSITNGPIISTPVAAGLTLAIFVYTIGSVSGSQINPAVTIGLFSIGKMKPKDTALYIIAQLIGAAIACTYVSKAGFATNELGSTTSVAIVLAEAVGTALLVFGITSVVYKKVQDTAAGLVIGGSLLLGLLVAAHISLGVLNPAVAMGIKAMSLAYFIGPLLGGIAGAWLGKYLFEK